MLDGSVDPWSASDVEGYHEVVVAEFAAQVADRQALADWLSGAAGPDTPGSGPDMPVSGSVAARDRVAARRVAGRLGIALGGGLAAVVEEAVFGGAGGAGGVLAELSDSQVVDLITAVERVHRWSAFVRGRVMVALADRWAGRNPTEVDDPSEPPADTGDDLSGSLAGGSGGGDEAPFLKWRL